MLLWSAPVGPFAGNRQPVGGLAYGQTPLFYQGKTIRIVVGSDRPVFMTFGLGYWPFAAAIVAQSAFVHWLRTGVREVLADVERRAADFASPRHAFGVFL